MNALIGIELKTTDHSFFVPILVTPTHKRPTLKLYRFHHHNHNHDFKLQKKISING